MEFPILNTKNQLAESSVQTAVINNSEIMSQLKINSLFFTRSQPDKSGPAISDILSHNSSYMNISTSPQHGTNVEEALVSAVE